MRKLLFGAIILSIFSCGLMVGHYKVFPFRQIEYIKNKLEKALSNGEELNSRITQCVIPYTTGIDQESVVVAGHVYAGSNEFVNKRFVKFLNENRHAIAHVFLTGDVLRSPTLRRWGKVEDLFGSLGLSFNIAPGNHDVGWGDNARRDIFSKSYFVQDVDVTGISYKFVLEDSTASNWEISKATIEKLNHYLESGMSAILLRHHIPVMELLHEANSLEGYPGSLRELADISEQINGEVLILAGDGGNSPDQSRHACISNEGVKILVNGLGNVSNDEVVIINKSGVYLYKL